MKKILLFLITVVLAVACAVGVTACKKSDDGGKLSVYVPDGAPALSVATLSNSSDFNVNVIDAGTINTKVTGENPQADIAILPLNAAVKLLGNGEKYKMLGTVTHGNLFLLKKEGQADITTPADLTKLSGKTVGIINLANVPGLTFKVILRDNGIENVNLVNVTPLQVVPTNADCDYFVVPEPAATTKISATQGKLSLAGSLQTLYGGENGYPQAVAVVKKSVIENNAAAVDKFIASFVETESWLLSESTSPEQIISAIDKMTNGDLQHTFNAGNITKTVIQNCGIKFVAAADCKEEVKTFMQKFNAVSDNAWGAPSDNFFYEKA